MTCAAFGQRAGKGSASPHKWMISEIQSGGYRWMTDRQNRAASSRSRQVGGVPSPRSTYRINRSLCPAHQGRRPTRSPSAQVGHRRGLERAAGPNPHHGMSTPPMILSQSGPGGASSGLMKVQTEQIPRRHMHLDRSEPHGTVSGISGSSTTSRASPAAAASRPRAQASQGRVLNNIPQISRAWAGRVGRVAMSSLAVGVGSYTGRQQGQASRI